MPLTDSSVNQSHTESREYRSSPPPQKVTKGERVCSKKCSYQLKSKNPDARKNVEVLYDNGKWYRGWLDSFNLKLAGGLSSFRTTIRQPRFCFQTRTSDYICDYNYFFHILTYMLCYPSNEPIIMNFMKLTLYQSSKLSLVTNVDCQISSIRFPPPPRFF